MATAKEKFLKLKEDAKLKKINLSLNEFGDSFSLIKNLFNDLILDVTNIDIISEAEDRFKIKAISKDFLFKSNVFKNRGVILEAEFSFSDGELEILAICKLEKMPSKLSKLPGIIGDLLSPLDFIKIDSLIYVLTSKDISIIKSETFPEYNNREVNFKPGINLAGLLDLKNSGSIASLVIKPLKPLVGEGPYFMSWNMKDKLDIDFSLSLPKDIELENIFTIKRPKLVLKPLKTPVISIDGIFDVKLPGVSVSLDGGFAFTADGIRGKFKMDEIASKIKAPLGYVGVHLSTLTVSAGISNGIPIVGTEGDFYIGPDAPGDVGNKPAVKEFGGIRSNQYKFIFQALP
ncbi:MAG: hypothetical protein IPP64_11795 [Bacteroidetes bacterium]|nr:hypothetical protein [Bacteroidota bacterium]